MTITDTIQTQTGVALRIPGDLFRAVDPGAFSFPEITAHQTRTEYGTVFTVTADAAGIEESFDLLNTVDAEWVDVEAAVVEFNADPIAGWQGLIAGFFREQRDVNAKKAATLDADNTFLFELEAGLLRA